MHSSRHPLIAGKWKMNLTLRESTDLIKAILDGLPESGTDHEPEVMVAPPFIHMTAGAELLKGSPVRLGAQDMHWEGSGAFTGEISAVHLKDLGCTYVILGHS